MAKFTCSCFFTHNVFLHEYKLHVRYFKDDQRFLEEYAKELESRGCRSESQLQRVLETTKAELSRRECLGSNHAHNCEEIRKRYQPLHPDVYQLQETIFESEFLEIVRYCQCRGARAEDLLERISQEESPCVFSFPVFTRSFCEQLLEELQHFEGTEMPRGRPNTMNRGGLLLSELGFDPGFTNPLREHYLMPIARLLYPNWVGGGLDSHRAFVVKYALGEDRELNYHFDNAEVTLNVCLGKKFEGGSLYFGGMRTEPHTAHTLTSYTHAIGRGVLHRGQHMHGAHPIVSGDRYNLIVWMRASSIRNRLCPMCDTPPKLVPTEGPGDGFTRKNDGISCDLS